METITYGKIGKEDLQLGRSTFEATLGDGRVVSLNEINLDSFDKILSTEDAVTNDITNVLTVRHTTTGTPAASMGTRVTLQAESADEDPSDLLGLEGAFDDVTAGSEDSTAYLLLRRAGNALSRAFGFRNTGNFLLLFSAALTAARTWTFQDATDTVVGRATTDTLTNKTLTDPTVNAGSGSETFRPNGHIGVELTAGSTGANLTETDLISFTVPANTLSANGRGLRIKAWGTVAGNVNDKTVRLYFGNSVIASNNISGTPNGIAWRLEAEVFRTGATTEDCIGGGRFGQIAQSEAFTLATEDTTGAITVKVTGQNGVATASDITAEGLTVEYLNG